MSERPALHHMLILQGSDFEREFELRAGVAVREPIANFSGSGTILIWDSPIAAPASTILQLGSRFMLLFAALAVGDRQIQVSPGTIWGSAQIPLKEGDEIGVKSIDITGWTFQSQIWVSQEAKLAQLAPLATFSCAVSNGVAGKFKLSLSKTISTPIKPTCSWEDLQGVKLEDLGKPEIDLRRLYGQQSWRPQSVAGSAYYWDVESTDTTPRTIRRIEGLVVLSKERTR